MVEVREQDEPEERDANTTKLAEEDMYGIIKEAPRLLQALIESGNSVVDSPMSAHKISIRNF